MLFLAKILLVLLHLCAATAKVSSDKVIFCYWRTWGYYNSSDAEFTVDNINPHLCTHICYKFLTIKPSGVVHLLDSHMESDLNKTVALKKINPNLKIIAGVHGSAEQYFAMAAEKDLRQFFITSAFTFLRKHGLDGIDIHWSNPTLQRVGSHEDSDNYITFLKQIYPLFLAYDYLVMFSVGPADRLPQQFYNIREMSKYLSLINVPTYDFHSPWNKALGHNAPLRADDQNTVAASIEYWISQGAPPSKIVMSIPLFGRSFTMPPLENRKFSTLFNLTLAFINAHGFLSIRKPSTEKPPQYNATVGAPSTGPGLQGLYVYESGLLSYNEICNITSDWTTKWDEVSEVPFSYKENQWISYDNELSIAAKVKFIKEQKLAGAVIWSIEMDDFLGKCKSQKFPLLHAIKSLLQQTS